jgi:hypothetical protein
MRSLSSPTLVLSRLSCLSRLRFQLTRFKGRLWLVIFGIAPVMRFGPTLVEASIYKGFPRFRTRSGPIFFRCFSGGIFDLFLPF